MAHAEGKEGDDSDGKDPFEGTKLFPQPACIDKGMLKVSDVHTISYEVYGNPKGKPVLFVHGGPGGGTDPSMARYFDPKVLATPSLVPLAHLPPSPAITPHPITTLLPCARSLLCDPLSFASITSLVLLCSTRPPHYHLHEH
jgi:hypothetical protein